MSIKVPGVTGRLTGDPELRFTPAGLAVVRFMVVTDTARRKADGWVSEETSLWRCTAWNDLAVNIAESLRRGQRIFIQGRLKEHSWTDKHGYTCRSVELVVDDCGPSLKFAKAKVSKVDPAGPRSVDADEPWAI